MNRDRSDHDGRCCARWLANVFWNVAVGPLLAAHLAASAALGHAGWDAVHHYRDKVVDRSLTEFCFVLDLGLGLLLLLAAWDLIPA